MKIRPLTLLPIILFLPLLALAQKTGSLCVKANPSRAGVFVEGKYLGPASNFGVARTYSVEPGDHEVMLVEPRYEELTTKVTIQPGKKTAISQTMKAVPLVKPPFGSLRTQNPDKFAVVYVNDRFMGHVDEFGNPFQGLFLNPGEYTVKIVPLNGLPLTQSFKIEADKTVIVK